MRCKCGVRALLSVVAVKVASEYYKWWHGGDFIGGSQVLVILTSLQHNKDWNRWEPCVCVLRCLMFVALCIWAFIKLINRILVHKIQIKSGIVTADEWLRLKACCQVDPWFAVGRKKRQEADLHVLKVSRIPDSLFLNVKHYSSLLMNFYFFAGEICALKSRMDSNILSDFSRSSDLPVNLRESCLLQRSHCQE